MIAGHGNLEKVMQMLAGNPALLNAPYQWSESDKETAIQAAAQVGNRKIAEFLLDKGAPLETCTAAMLDLQDEVQRRIDGNPQEAYAVGAHKIPLLPHAAWSENLELVQFVYRHGAIARADLALHHAVLRGNTQITEWLLDNARPEIGAKNFQGKTPLTVATERNDRGMVRLLKSRGATQ